jgi:hypothetical protein
LINFLQIVRIHAGEILVVISFGLTFLFSRLYYSQQRLSERTAELQSGAENFASMANELAKQMEKRKWWNI